MIFIAGASILEFVIFLWSLFTLPIYILVIIMLIKYHTHNSFKAPFFKLCISEGFADFGVFLITTIFMSFRVWGWIYFYPIFNHPTYDSLFRLCYALPYMFGIPQVTGVAIIGLNRFMSILFPAKPRWSRKKVNLAICIQWMTGVAACLPWASQIGRISVHTMNTTVGVYPRLEASMPFQSIYYVSVGLFTLILVLLVGFMYAAMFVKMCRHNKRMANSSISTRDSAKIRLAVMGFVLFLFLLFYTLCFVAAGVAVKLKNPAAIHWGTVLIYQSAILSSMANPWLLLVFSEKTRRKFKSFMGLPAPTNVVSVKSRASGRTDNKSPKLGSPASRRTANRSPQMVSHK